MNYELIIEIIGFLLGLLYLWWEYHADTRLWIVSMIMPLFSMWVYFNKGLYADFGIAIYYFAVAVYGYIIWTKKEHIKNKEQRINCKQEKEKDKDELPITHTPGRMVAVCIAGALALWALLYLGLNYLTDSTVPIADAFTTALSIVGMWMLARKYLEQWLVWIAVDAVSTGLYFYKGIYFYCVLYAIYTVIACFGYRKWLKLMQKS